MRAVPTLETTRSLQDKGSGPERCCAPLTDAPSVVERQASQPDISDPSLDERVMECTMGDVFVSFVGRKAPGSNSHRAIAALLARRSVVPDADKRPVEDGRRQGAAGRPHGKEVVGPGRHDRRESRSWRDLHPVGEG